MQKPDQPYVGRSPFLAVKDFEDILIFYVIRPEALRIVRILHGMRDINKILEREKDSDLIN